MSSYRNIQEQSGAVPDSKPQTFLELSDDDKWKLLAKAVRGANQEQKKLLHICLQSGCRNTFLNQEGYCMPHYTARNTEGMFTNEERK